MKIVRNEQLERMQKLAGILTESQLNEESTTSLDLNSNIVQTWKTADDVKKDMALWLSSVYASGKTLLDSERLYDEMVDTINSVIEDFDPNY